jgi:hypothetical protein
VFENRILRRTSGPKGEEVTGGWKKIARSFIICTLRRLFLDNEFKENETGGT